MKFARIWPILMIVMAWASARPALAETDPASAQMRIALSAKCDAGKAAACFELGETLAQGADDTAQNRVLAANAYKAACDAQFAKACNRLGDLYSAGRGVPRNDGIAVELYTRACAAKEAEACSSLGDLTSRGTGTARDDARAVQLYATACAGGYLPACAYEADGWFNGDAGAIDPAHGAALLDAACKRGAEDSCLALANRLFWGNPMPKDPVRAEAMLDRNCRAKMAGSCYRLGEALQSGRDLPKDPARASSYFDRACQIGDAKACDAFARTLYKGIGVVPDKEWALALFDWACGQDQRYCESARFIRAAPALSKACDDGVMASCVDLAGFQQAYNSVLRDDAKTRALYSRACDGGIAASCGEVARLMRNAAADGVPVDEQAVFGYNKRACDGGDLSACFTLADAYADGIGVTANAAEAARLYAKACAGSISGACRERDMFAGLAADIPIESANADYKPPAEAGLPSPKSGNCTTEETRFEGRVFTQKNCTGYTLNGFDITPGSAPWQALIERPPSLNGQNLGATDRVLCGGSLIAKGWILTAAHCLYVDRKNLVRDHYRVRLGLYDVTRKEGISYPILDVIKHKDFRSGDPTYANDIALIRYDINAPSRLGDLRDMKTVRIDETPVGKRTIYDGMSAYTYGWGWTAPVKSQASATLKGAKLALRTEDQCTKITRFGGPLANAVLCAAGLKGQQACSGDSGGPLIYYGDPDGVPRVIGVVSAGKRCGTLGEPSRYTRVAWAAAWIRSIVWPSARR